MKTETASHGTPTILMTLFDDPPWLFLGFSMMFASTGDAAACIFQIQTQPKINTKIPKQEKKIGHAKEVNNLYQDTGVCWDTTATGSDDLNISFHKIIRNLVGG